MNNIKCALKSIRFLKMHSKSALLASLILACACQSGAQNYVTNQSPLVPEKYIELPLGSIKPQGWLLTQLQIMNQGSTGHLDETYAPLKNDNGWLGGKGESL